MGSSLSARSGIHEYKEWRTRVQGVVYTRGKQYKSMERSQQEHGEQTSRVWGADRVWEQSARA